MGYKSTHNNLTAVLFKAQSCPYLVAKIHCAGGDYCPFPEGGERLCCFYCGKLDSCPDKTGICVRLKDEEDL